VAVVVAVAVAETAWVMMTAAAAVMAVMMTGSGEDWRSVATRW
jgi:hypothetical protein